MLGGLAKALRKERTVAGLVLGGVKVCFGGELDEIFRAGLPRCEKQCGPYNLSFE